MYIKLILKNKKYIGGMMKAKHKKEHKWFKILFCALALGWVIGIYFFSPVIQSDVSNNVIQADSIQMNVG